MSGEHSKLSAIKNEIVGAVKENVGKAIGNKQMQAEGKITREQGHMERKAVHAETKAKGLHTSGTHHAAATAGSTSGGEGGGIIGKVKGMGEKLRGHKKHPHGTKTTGRETEHSTQMKGLLATIRKGDFHLKHPQQVNDRSAPIIDKSFKLKKFDRKPLFDEIRKGGWNLRHVQPVERSIKALFPEGYKLRRNNRDALFDEIKKGGWRLRRVKTNDRSAPRLERIHRVKLPNALLKDITKHNFRLNHVTTVERTLPEFVTTGFHLRKLDRKPFLEEVRKGAHLKHVETCDKSALHLPKTFHLLTPLPKMTESAKMADKGKERMDMQKSMGLKATTSH